VIRVIVAGRIRLSREALAEVLGHRPRLAVTGTADPGEDLLRMLQLNPDIVLVDGSSAEALEVSAVVEAAPQVKVIVYGVPDSALEIIHLAEAGAHGYLAEGGTMDELETAMEQAMRGEMSCPPRVAGLLVRRIRQLAAETNPLREEPDHLTRRELEVLDLLEQGLTNKEIAARLGIEVSTTKNHVHNILKKLHVSHRGEAAARARSGTPRAL